MREYNDEDLVSTFKYAGIEVKLFWDGYTDSHYKAVMSYITSYKGKEMLRGNDLHLPCSIAEPDTKGAMIQYLMWLVVREGDTDKDFFKSYSQEALDFVNKNSDLDQVRVRIWDIESGEKAPVKFATKWFNSKIKLS